jgi:hypothetical protein
MHPEFDKFYDYSATVLLTNGEKFVYQQTGDQSRELEYYLTSMDTRSREGIPLLFIGFYTITGRFVAINNSRIRHIRLLYDPKNADSLPTYDDHFAVRETQRRTEQDLASDERKHRMYEAESAGHPDDPMPAASIEEAEAFLQTLDIDLEAELPGIEVPPMTITSDDDIPDIIVYTAYPTKNGNAENDLARNSYFYYDMPRGTLYHLDVELLYADDQRSYLMLADEDADLDCIPLEAVWLIEASAKMLEHEVEEGEEEEEEVEGGVGKDLWDFEDEDEKEKGDPDEQDLPF